MANRRLTTSEIIIGLAGTLAKKKAYVEERDLEKFLSLALRGDRDGISNACDLSYVKGQVDFIEILVDALKEEWPVTIENVLVENFDIGNE